MNKTTQTLLLFCFILCTFSLKAQNHQTAMNSEKFGFFIAPQFGLTSMDGSNTSIFNLRGGLTLESKFSVGAYFATSLNEIEPSSEAVPNLYMDYWSVGGFAEYTLFTDRIVHLSIPLYIGYGEVEMDNDIGNVQLGESNFLQLEPSLLMEVHINPFVRLNLGASYRFIGSMEYRNFDQSDLSGITGYFGLKLGIFK